ncbi:MAG: mechanosensitive ion channel family protein [Clostridiales bacterium]|nr:mechanosensitive ion channel family protein [Clostridiales bacterium]
MPWYQKAWNWIKDYFTSNWTHIIIFFCVLIFGIILIKIILSLINRALKKSTRVNKTARHFFIGVLKAVLYIIYIIALLSLLGIPTTSMIALLSAFALAISLALQDTISNLASGVVLIFTKPFSEGDYIELSDGAAGTVTRITMFNTRLLTPSNQVVIIPNKTAVDCNVTNYSMENLRRLDVPLSVAYGTDVEKVKEVGLAVAHAHEKVLKDPAPMTRLDKHGASSLDFILRVWVQRTDYWDVYFDLREQVVAAFNENGIEIPFNQLDVHVKEDVTVKELSQAAAQVKEKTDQPVDNGKKKKQ